MVVSCNTKDNLLLIQGINCDILRNLPQQMDLSTKTQYSTSQGILSGMSSMALNYSLADGGGGAGGSENNASFSSPSFSGVSFGTGSTPGRGRSATDSFPYGLSGVSMPNYGYPNDLYQFTSNGYPRKSRTCNYCGKVFTRSTTRRYHERRCPLLRASLCSSVVTESNDNKRGASGAQALKTTSPAVSQSSIQDSHTSGTDLKSHMSGNIYPQTHYKTTSKQLPPHVKMEQREEEGLNYHTSVIVKKEAQEQFHAQESSHNQSHEIISRITPDSHDSSSSVKASEARGFSHLPFADENGHIVSKSPSGTSDGQDASSAIPDEYIQDSLKGDMDTRLDRSESGLNYSKEQMAENNNSLLSHDVHESDFISQGPVELAVGNSNESTSNNMSQDSAPETDDKDLQMDGKVTNDDDAVETKCEVCGKVFPSKWQLHVHEHIHKNKLFEPYECRFCGKRFSKAALRIAHERDHMGESHHVCAVCGSSFTRKYSLRLHMKRRHLVGPWLCRHCGKVAQTHKDLYEHLQSHDLPMPERDSLKYLPDAPGGAGDEDLLDDGDEDMELNENDSEVMSDVNDNETLEGQESPIDNLQRYEEPSPRGGDDSEPKEMCTICGRDFPKSHMPHHMKHHEGQKPYTCPICGKKFGYKNNMKSHIKLHAGIKPYQCSLCKARFTRGSTLRRHAKRHGISAESFWEFFVKNGGVQQQQAAVAASDSGKETAVKPDSGYGRQPQSSPEEASAKSDVPSFMDSTYNSLFGTPTSVAMSNALLMSYHNHRAAVAAATFPSIFNTSVPPSTSVESSDGMGPLGPNQVPQTFALNLSVQRSAKDDAAYGQDNDLDTSLQNHVERLSPTSVSRSRSRSLSGSDILRPTITSTPSISMNCNDVGIQVKNCCNTVIEPSCFDDRSPSVHSDNSGSIYQQKTSSILDISTESISTLLATGRLFKCDHCECYFSEYAMYRIHAKLHVRGQEEPFICPVCNENCHDKTYFSMHIAEHLR